MYRNKDGTPKRYFFSNLQNEDLFDLNYSSWNGIKEVYSQCINFTVNTINRDSTKEVSLFLYLIDPPRFSFKYSILKKKKEAADEFLEVQKLISHV